MRILLLLTALLFAGNGIAQSQVPPPTPSKDAEHQKSHPTTTDEKATYNPAGTDKQPFVVKSLEAEKTPERTEQERPERKEKAANEWRLIVWTMVLAGATIVLALFAGGQIALFWWQLRLIRESLADTKKAADAANKSADAAQASVDISREALTKAQRAYICISGFPWLWRQDLGREGKYLYDITPTIENTGVTPTIEMDFVVDSALRDTPLPNDFNFPYLRKPQPSLIGPHQTVRVNSVRILDTDLLAVQKGEKFFYIWGTITYLDIFEGTPRHTTEFCTYISDVMGNPLNPTDPSNFPKGTSLEIFFPIYDKHNRIS